MRIKTVGLVVAGAAVVAGVAGGVAWASTGDAQEPTPSVRIVQQEQPTQPEPQQPQRDCPEKNGGSGSAAPAPSAETL